MPSLIKELAYSEVQRMLKAFPGLILIDPKNLNSVESLALRRQLKGLGARIRVVKARVIRKAAPGDLSGVLKAKGSLALVGATDLAAVAKVINELAKTEKIAIRAGIMEGRAVDAAGAARFSDLPTKTQAQAMVVKALRAPTVKLARLLKAPYARLGRALKKHSDKVGGGT